MLPRGKLTVILPLIRILTMYVRKLLFLPSLDFIFTLSDLFN